MANLKHIEEQIQEIALENLKVINALAIRKATAEAETAELLKVKAEAELDTQILLREYIRKSQLAADLPGFKTERVS